MESSYAMGEFDHGGNQVTPMDYDAILNQHANFDGEVSVNEWGEVEYGTGDQPSRCRLATQILVSSTKFDALMGFVVVVNAMFLAVENEIPQNEDSVVRVFTIADAIFLAIFTIELISRIFAFGFACIRNSSAMMLDVVIVATGWLTEVIVPLTTGAFAVDMKVLQALKVLRVLRAVRVLRLMTMFRDLWLVVQAFFLCLKPLVWTVLFILIIIFIFAMFSVELIGNGIRLEFEEGSPVVKSAERFVSTIPALVALFQMMTLDSWHRLVSPLFNAAPWTYFFFLTYIAVSALCLMNLITAVVIDSAMRSMEEEEDFQRRLFDQQVEQLSADLHSMFEAIDEDGVGEISMELFVKNAMKARPVLDVCEIMQFEGPDLPVLFHGLLFAAPQVSDGAESIATMPKDEKARKTLEPSGLIHGMMIMQRIAQDKSAVALIRAGRSPAERLHYLKQHVTDADKDSGKAGHSLESTIQAMNTSLDKFITALTTMHTTAIKISKHFGIDEEMISTANKPRRQSGASRRSFQPSIAGSARSFNGSSRAAALQASANLFRASTHSNTGPLGSVNEAPGNAVKRMSLDSKSEDHFSDMYAAQTNVGAPLPMIQSMHHLEGGSEEFSRSAADIREKYAPSNDSRMGADDKELLSDARVKSAPQLEPEASTHKKVDTETKSSTPETRFGNAGSAGGTGSIGMQSGKKRSQGNAALRRSHTQPDDISKEDVSQEIKHLSTVVSTGLAELRELLVTSRSSKRTSGGRESRPQQVAEVGSLQSTHASSLSSYSGLGGALSLEAFLEALGFPEAFAAALKENGIRNQEDLCVRPTRFIQQYLELPEVRPVSLGQCGRLFLALKNLRESVGLEPMSETDEVTPEIS